MDTTPHSTIMSTSLSAGAFVPLAPYCVFSAMTHRDNNCERRTVAQGVEIQSISLSLITLITRVNVQVPMTIGTRLPKFDPSGTTRNTTSSSYPATSFT